MAEKGQFSQWFKERAKSGAAAALVLSLIAAPVIAQGVGGPNMGTFESYFSPYSAPPKPKAPVERSVDYSRAPSPRKPDTAPTGGNILVFGDSLADWLAYGLEDALGDTPDFGVVRRNRASSGLIRYEGRTEREDWPQAIREAIAQTKPKFVVMMVGLNDRNSIRDRIVQPSAPAAAAAPGATAPKTPAAPGTAAEQQPAASEPKADTADAEQSPAGQPTIVAPEPQPRVSSNATTRTYEFHTDEWAAAYEKRIDATIAALKSAGVPVFWVGLPSIRGPKATSDMQYLSDLYRARAEKASISYIDVWDGFVDDSGRFTPQGPDFEGQIRRLRANDGIHFTRAGARKLAHYLDREIRRVLAPGAEVVALPSTEPQAPAAPAKPSGPAARPLAGPVVPLTASVTSAQELVGARDTGDKSIPKFVTRALVEGEAIAPPAGRSDDFAWPRRAIAPVGADPVVATTTEPIPVMKAAPETTVAAPNADVRPVAAAAPPAPVRRASTTGRAQAQQQQQPASPGFFSFFR